MKKIFLEQKSNFMRSVAPVLIGLLALSAPSARAQLYVTARPSPSGAGANTSPPYYEVATTYADSTGKSSVSDAPARSGCRYRTSMTASTGFGVQLTNDTVAGATYKLEVTVPSPNSGTDVVYSISSTNATLSTSTTSGFQRSVAANVWSFICYITNSPGQLHPYVEFDFVSGNMNGGSRSYADVFKFTLLANCINTAVPTTQGPFAAGQTTVTVSGVTNASAVTVYQDTGGGMVQIGQKTSGLVNGANTVTVTALTKNAKVAATQTVAGQESCVPTVGPVVGGGANPALRLALNMRQTGNLTGPAGAPGPNTGGTLYFVPATGVLSSSPTNGVYIAPSPCWQTITINPQTDPQYLWAGASMSLPDPNQFASLEGFALCMVDTNADTGPYAIYIDNIMNGSTVIENFENATNGSSLFFLQPGYAGFPVGMLLPTPNSSTASTNFASEGSNSGLINWQFKDNSAGDWVRLIAGVGANNYPQIDLHQPLSMDILVLPVGTSAPHPFNGVVGGITNAAPYATATNILGVTVTGSGPYTYQWNWSGGPLTDPTTNRTYELDSLSAANNGFYTVTVSDGTCSVTRGLNLTVLDPVPTITNQPAHAVVNTGGTINFAVGADGHVSIGYPLSYQWRSNGVEIIDETNSTLSIPSAQLANVGSYDVYVWNNYGYVTSVVATVDVVASGISVGSGVGLHGDYWTMHFSTNAFSAAPTLSRTDPVIDFDWGTGSPDPSLSSDYFTARWSGEVQALGDDTYTFYTISDDGIRLWVNGQKLIDNWTLHPPTTNNATITLQGTNKYDLLLEYFENAGGAVAKLDWSNAGGSVGFEPVPASQLYPGSGLASPALNFSLNDGTNLVFNWGPGTANLLWSAIATGPFTNVIYGLVSPYTVQLGADPQRFYRLQLQ